MQLQRNTKLIETVFETGRGKSNLEQLKKSSSGKGKDWMAVADILLWLN